MLSKREIEGLVFMMGTSRGSASGVYRQGYQIWCPELRPLFGPEMTHAFLVMGFEVNDYRLAQALVRTLRQEISRRLKLQEQILTYRASEALKG